MVGLGVLVIILFVAVGAAVAKRTTRSAAPDERRGITAAQLQRATEAGIVTADQATALLTMAPIAASPHPVRLGGWRGVPAAAEIFGYLGAVLAIVGAATLVGQFWADLARWSRLALIGLLALGLWGAGVAVDESAGAVFWRLRGFLWLVSSGAVAFFAGLVGADVFEWEPAPVAILVGATTALYAAALWRRRDRPAQHLAFVGGAVATLAGFGASIDGPGTVGLLLWAFGGIWLLLGRRGIVVPAFVALVVSPGIMLAAAGVTAGSWEWFAPAFGLVTAAGLLVAGTTLDETLITAVGVLGVFVFLPMAGAEYFGEAIGVPIVLLVAGALLIALDARDVAPQRRPRGATGTWWGRGA